MLTPDELAALAHAISAGDIVTAGGRTLSEAPQAGLMTINGRMIYPIEDEIPVMLVDESIAAEQISGMQHAVHD